MQVKKAIINLSIVLACAQCAQAEEIFTGSGFTTGTSFERLETGEFIAGRDDYGEYYWDYTSNYWETATQEGQAIPGATVKAYEPGKAYPYEGTERNKMFGSPYENKQYLELNLAAVDVASDPDAKPSLDRRILLCTNEEGAVSMDHVVLERLKDGIFADTLVQMTPCVSSPATDGSDKIVVWLRESDSGDGTVTNLVITAGRFAGGLDQIEKCDYVIGNPSVAAGEWCRLTIRMIADITGKRDVSGNVSGDRAAAFTVYVDGKPACGDASYDVGSGYRTDRLLPEARTLISERRLFPCLVRAGYAGAVEVSRFAFDGQGAIDDVIVTTERPGHVVSETVFTLQWDAGVKSMTCVVSNAAAVVTNEIDATELPRFRDFAFGTASNALVTVTDVAYDTDRDYLPGVWRAEDCALAGNVFTCDGNAANPIGFVASTRNVVGVGAGCATTFAEAKATAKKTGVRTIALQSDMVVSSGVQTSGYSDSGRLSVVDSDDIVLDLCGHTLQGANRNVTVWQTGGKLSIIDSSDAKTGRILPAEKNVDRVAVRSESSASNKPELRIEAGWYDGYVVITNNRNAALGTCVISGGSFTNANNATDYFYLDQFVDSGLYFGLSGDYWTTVTNGYVWCGLGKNARWDTPANWKGQAVPTADDLAIFPRIAGGKGSWAVDFGEGVATKKLWLDADVFMTGTNDFTDVTVVSGKGRIVGTGTAKFTGRLPGVLTSEQTDGEIRLGDGWKGTVRISEITKAQPLTNIMGWGNAGSKVEFAGVRGYLSDRSNHALPYGLVLTNEGTAPAWRNDTGYTGSVVSFPTLEGSGTFLSPANSREILQVFQFRNVEAFTGKFDLGGKRLLLGAGYAPSKAAAGHFVFADAVKVRSNLKWAGVSAHFGSQLGVYGAFGDPLMTFSGVAPDVSGVEVLVTDAKGEQKKGSLAVVENVVVIAENVEIGGKSVAAMSVASVVKDGSVIDVPAGAALSIEGNNVVINGKIVSTVADYYKVKPVASGLYAVSFDKEAVTPTLAGFSVGSSGGQAVVQVTNAKRGLWYILQSTSSLEQGWNTIGRQQAEGDTVTFTPALGDTSSFYRVIMTDKDPNGGEE